MMADKSNIEWTDATWNPIVGCSVISPGCTNCYAMKMAARIQKMNRTGGAGSNYVNHYDGTTQSSKAGAVWTGKIALAPDKLFLKPLSWKSPRKIFVNSMGDLFHESIPDEWIDRVFAVMALCPQHTFQVLTKRAGRMRDYLLKVEVDDPDVYRLDFPALDYIPDEQWHAAIERGWPLDNVWLGVSCERQQEADERIPLLLQTPAAVRFISAEPLLGPINLMRLGDGFGGRNALTGALEVGMGIEFGEKLSGLDWVIAGGESGPGSRPMDPYWARSLRDQCAAADVPFFFKQWGEFAPLDTQGISPDEIAKIETEGQVFRVGKKSAGRLLDGKKHNEFPQAREHIFA